MNVEQVTASKPKIGGAVWRALAGATLPTTAVAELGNSYANLGYISSDGVKNNTEITSENVKAWGGDVVLSAENGKVDTFQVKFIEATNIDVLKAVYVDSNVDGTSLDGGITVRANSTEHTEDVFVIDTILKGGVIRRVVIPRGKITAIGEIQYVDNAPVGYDATITALPYATWEGDTHREYTVKPSTTSSTP